MSLKLLLFANLHSRHYSELYFQKCWEMPVKVDYGIYSP